MTVNLTVNLGETRSDVSILRAFCVVGARMIRRWLRVHKQTPGLGETTTNIRLKIRQTCSMEIALMTMTCLSVSG